MSSVTVLQSIVWSFVLSYLKLFSLLQEYWWNQVAMIKLWETKPWKTSNHCCYNLLELNRIVRQISACIYEWWCKTQPEVSLCLLYWVRHKWCFKGRGVRRRSSETVLFLTVVLVSFQMHTRAESVFVLYWVSDCIKQQLNWGHNDHRLASSSPGAFWFSGIPLLWDSDDLYP